MKLGFAVKVAGREGLRSNDSRRWQNNPHLSVSLAYLRDIFLYLRESGIKMYRMSSDLAPYVTHPELTQFHNQIQDCADELAAVGEMARQGGLRLSFHPAAFIVLNAADEAIAQKSVADFEAQSRMLDLMGLGAEAVVVTHVGGVYGDKVGAMRRFVERYRALSEPVKRRLVLENDERNYTLGDAYAIHEQTGIRLVFDQLHEQCNPTPGLTPRESLQRALDTWPAGQTPKVHYSTTRTAMVETGEGRLQAPRLSQHADLIDPFAFVEFVRRAEGLRDFDVMLECKAKDIALLRLRGHLGQTAVDLVRERCIE